MEKPYKMPQNYIKWDTFLGHKNKMELISPLEIYSLKNFNPARNLAHIFSEWSKGYPVYCVRECLIKDMLETDVGDNIALFLDIDLIENYMLCFPKKTIKSPINDGYIDYLIVNIAENKRSQDTEYKYIISWGCIDSNDMLLFSGKGINKNGNAKQSYFQGSEIKRDIVYQIRNIVLQSILILQYYPKLQEEMKELATTVKGFSKPQKPTDCRLPRWLGSEKATKDYDEKPQNNSSAYSGATKSKHYRRWHWRLQPCGKGRQDIKAVRVRGAWINPDMK